LSEFKKSAKMFLKDARKDLKNKRYASCVIHAHLVIEHALKAMLSKKRLNVKFKAIPELTQEALKRGIIDENISNQILNINSLRNTVYHEGYIPRANEAKNALKTAEKCFHVLTSQKT